MQPTHSDMIALEQSHEPAMLAIQAKGNTHSDEFPITVSSGSPSTLEVLEAKRRYKREFMRRWRLDPRHQELERVGRDRSRQKRKLRRIRREESSGDAVSIKICGICRSRRSVTEITRLRIADQEPSGFVSVRVPYCGQC